MRWLLPSRQIPPIPQISLRLEKRRMLSMHLHLRLHLRLPMRLHPMLREMSRLPATPILQMVLPTFSRSRRPLSTPACKKASRAWLPRRT